MPYYVNAFGFFEELQCYFGKEAAIKKNIRRLNLVHIRQTTSYVDNIVNNIDRKSLWEEITNLTQ